MPAVVGLDDLAAMNAADTHGRRYETSPEGILFVLPPPDSEHAIIASRLFAWLIQAGWPPEQVLQATGIRIPGPPSARAAPRPPTGARARRVRVTTRACRR
jgi:hypothetical protein